ncbi:MAG: XTP/dITP diphosphatase [Anaerovoracaceae bacterium]
MSDIVVAASRNRHKIEEIDAITRKFGMHIISRDEAGVPDIEITEDGQTFEDNSLKKAREIMKLCGQITIADDSGLMVDCLDGAPGVYSARFAGEDGNDEKNNKKLLMLLEGIPEEKRTAEFVSVITMIYPDGTVITARGECRGRIITEPAGDNGFGYDPLFVPDGYDRTFAQLTAEEKNSVSHRAAALEKLKKLLGENMKNREGNED